MLLHLVDSPGLWLHPHTLPPPLPCPPCHPGGAAAVLLHLVDSPGLWLHPHTQEGVEGVLQPILMRLAARYLLQVCATACPICSCWVLGSRV